MLFGRRSISCLVLSLAFASVLPSAAMGQHRGRKYKAPPDTSHIEVLVLRDYNGKPIENAAVIFHSLMDGKDEGNLEVKTNGDGKAIIDVIPTGSNVDVQVIADGYATFAQTYLVSESDRTIQVKMLRPRAQVSTYVDNSGKASDRPAGVQEPGHPAPPAVQTQPPAGHPGDSTPAAPNGTPANSQNPTPQPH